MCVLGKQASECDLDQKCMQTGMGLAGELSLGVLCFLPTIRSTNQAAFSVSTRGIFDNISYASFQPS